MVWQNNGLGPLGVNFGWSVGLGFLVGLLILWSLVWKGLALWKAAQEKSMVWFVVLLIVNTAGILEILYIFGFSKHRGLPSSKPQ